MKRQSVEDYVKERFKMKSPLDEYILVTNKEIARKNGIDLSEYHKIVGRHDDGAVSIYSPRTGNLILLSRDDFAYEYIHIVNDWVAKKNGLRTDRSYKVTDIIRNYKGEEIGVVIIKDDLLSCYQIVITRGNYTFVKPPIDKEEKPKDEYVYVTNDLLLKNYDLDRYRMYKVVYHDDADTDVIGISIPTCPEDFTLFLCPGQYSYSDPNEPKNEPDSVNHPSHYETGKFECIEVMEEALGRDVVKGFCIGNAFRYLYRAKRKNGLEDMKKARWYLDKVISMEEEDNTKDPYAEQKKRLKDLEWKILNEAKNPE